MNWEQANNRWDLAQKLRDYFCKGGSDGMYVEGMALLREAADQCDVGPNQLKALLRLGPISCGPVVFFLSENEKKVQFETTDQDYMQSRAKLVVRWRKILERKGLEAALEAIAGFNLREFEIDLKHLHPTTDGWRVAFEAVDGEGRTPSDALVSALKRWVFGAPKVEGKPEIKRKRNGKRER